MKAEDRIIVALDTPSSEVALEQVSVLVPQVSRFKVGLELFCAAGPAVIEQIAGLGGRVFLDLKLHDIPNTVAGAARVLRRAGVWMTNVHAAGGPQMMAAAREAFPDAVLLAVTVLTSLDQHILTEYLGIPMRVEEVVGRWALRAQEEGLDGVVCSPREIGAVRSAAGDQFLVVTPGIRPTWSETGDQRRVSSPGEALRRGADYLVIGRPITGAADPRAAVRRLVGEMRGEVSIDE
ncbi:MAG: orotidine-5'-phosphate decarboxylase [Bacillota bacterium]